MTRSISKKNLGAQLTARLSESRYGTLQPTLKVELPAGAHYRAQSAACHFVAAALECASAPSDGWIVQIDSDRNEVYLELVHANKAEADRGMALLESVARSSL